MTFRKVQRLADRLIGLVEHDVPEPTGGRGGVSTWPETDPFGSGKCAVVRWSGRKRTVEVWITRDRTWLRKFDEQAIVTEHHGNQSRVVPDIRDALGWWDETERPGA